MTSTEGQGNLPFTGILAILRTTLMCCADKTFGEIFHEATGRRLNPGGFDDRTLAVALEKLIRKYAARDLRKSRIRSPQDVDLLIASIDRIWPVEVRAEISLGKALADLVGKSGMHLFYSVSDAIIIELSEVESTGTNPDNKLVAS